LLFDGAKSSNPARFARRQTFAHHAAMTESASRLGIGTVQFGQAYGVSNTRGRVPAADIAAILTHAAKAGVGVLDTAANYGEAEQVLGSVPALTRPFRLVTKTIALKNGLDAVLARARQSVATLHRKPVDLLLVHAASDLRAEGGRDLWNGLLALRDEGLFKDIGISAYVADDPVTLARRFGPAAMQLPLSLLDQRLIRSGALAAIKDLGIEIHARSLFLQGLLFLEADHLPGKLQSAAGHLEALRQRFREAGTTPLAAALGFALNRPEVDVAVVGVTTPDEFEELLVAAAAPAPSLDWPACALNNETVLTPSLW
jgi:aryl-alcohol dehydrogenase-like predicted oxidoreductase